MERYGSDEVHWLCEAVEAGDLQQVKELLARGCPVSPKNVRKPPLTCAIEAGNVAVLDALVEAGTLLGKDLDRMLLDAVADYQQLAIAMRLLELGADPLFQVTRMTADGTPSPLPDTPFENALALDAHELVAAMLNGISQAEKDEWLVMYVQAGHTRGTQAMLSAGADAQQRVSGLPLVDLTPGHAEEIRRMLRAIDTAAAIEAAMGRDDSAAAPAKPSFTL